MGRELTIKYSSDRGLPVSDRSYVYIKILISFFLVGCAQLVVVPPHLMGIWKTSSPRYEDRYLKFAEKTLTYGIGNGEEISHNIDRIDVNDENGAQEYTFHYKDEYGEKWTLVVTYRPNGTLQLQHGKEIWMKAELEDSK
jgi:hypothetical protein